MDREDDDIKEELKRIDPNDMLGILSILSTIANIICSIIFHYYTIDILTSMSIIFGILSIVNKNGIIPKISLILVSSQLFIIFLLRIQ